jgi:hypothetical protein
MRTSSVVVVATVVAGLVLGLEPTLPFDGTPSPNKPVGPDAARASIEPLKPGDKTPSLTALQYAAEHGHGVAAWQLGRMYAEGNGVPRNDLRAFEYFQKFADSHADDNPGMPRSRFVAHAFVSLGHYYLEGIPNTSVAVNPERARHMFSHAASYFGDPEAQFQLAMLYVKGTGVSRDPKRAVPWLVLAANKGHYKSQALLGRILFRGEHGSRQAATGLMWLTIACDGPGAKVPWIAEAREAAFKQASDDERAMALIMLERWVEGRRH